jgi:hypothetical protein|tara:strand:+ start:179 stop:1963 length:1785 start_codon:yes stop_codon:yes gene_type:complete
MNKHIYTILVFFISIAIHSQETDEKSSFEEISERLNVSVESNSQWYLNDEKFEDIKEDTERLRANSYLRVDYQISDRFSSGFQLESYIPEPLLNYSRLFDKEFGLGTFYLNYNTKKLDVTLGYYYVQFGSGLILRAWEDRALGVNNALRGGKVVYDPTNYLRMTALYGKQRKGFDVSNSDIFGFETQFDIADAFQLESLNSLQLGLSYVGKKESYKRDPAAVGQPAFDIPELINSFGAHLDLEYKNFYTNFEYIYKGEDARLNNVTPNVVSFSEEALFDGNAITWNIGYSQKGFGIGSTFRRLENMRFYSERSFSNVINNPTSDLSMNYLPALTKQHDYTLANIYLYQAQPGLTVASYESPLIKPGEIGESVDVFYNIKKGTLLGGKYGTKLSLNWSYWANLKSTYIDPSGTPYFVGDDLTYETELLNFDDKLYSEINVEMRKKWTPKLKSIFTYINLNYNKDFLESKLDGSSVNAWIGVAESTYKFQGGKSIRLELQHLSTNDDARNWAGGTIEYFFSSKFGIYLNDSYNYEESKITENTEIHFFNLGGSFTKGSTRVGVNYGRQRGGLLCVGGVCRPVSKNTGVTLNFVTTF